MIALPARAVIKRELLSGLRNPRPFFFLALFIAVMILGLLFLLDVVYENQLAQRGMINTNMVRELFMQLGMGLYLSAVLLIPPMAGVSICVEKQQDSYDLLRMTYIRPISLAVAKLTNVLGIYLLVVIASLPFVGVFFFLIGIDWHQFAISFSLIILSALSLAAIGLLCSAWFYRTLPAIIMTYILGLATHGGVLVALIIAGEILNFGSPLNRLFMRMGENMLIPLIPFSGIGIASQGTLGIGTIGYALIYHGGIVLIALWLTVSILRRPARPMKINTERPIDDQSVLDTRRKQFPYYLLDPRRRRPMIPDRQNPVLAKELQTGLLSRGTFAIRVFYGFTLFSFMISLFTIIGFGFGDHAEAMAGWTLFIDTIFILIIMPTLVATTMAKEWEWHNVDSLRTTLLSPQEIAAGKFRATLRTATLPVGGALLGNVILLFYGYDTPAFWGTGVMGLGMMLVCVVYTLAISYWVTANCRRSLTALLLAYAASIFVVALLPLVVMLISYTVQSTTYLDPGEMTLCSFLSPLHAFYAMLEYSDKINGFPLTTYWLLACLVFLGISVMLLSLTKRRYARSLNRGE